MPRLTGRYAMLEQLVAEGTKYIFGNPGTTEQGFIDALQEYPQLEYILALQEGVATGVGLGGRCGAVLPASSENGCAAWAWVWRAG